MKLVSLGLLAATLSVHSASGAQTPSPNSNGYTGPQVTVNGQSVAFAGQPPVEQAGRVLVPLRGVLERIGAFVQYDAQTKTITAFKGATRMTLPVGSRSALVNDRAVGLDVPAQIVNGSTLVPLRFVAQSLGADVNYNVATHTVAINTSGATPAPVAATPSTGVSTGTGTGTGTGTATSAVQDPAQGETTLTGTVVSVFNDVAPRRIVVRTGDGATVQERTIPLRDDAKFSVRRRLLPPVTIELSRVNVGDIVEVRQIPSGVATAVTVTRRVRAGNPPATPNAPVTTPNPDANAGNTATPTATTLRGEFLQADKAGSRYILKMTDGRLLEVEGDVPVFYGSDRVSIDDLRSGDQVTVALDPRTKRGTRITIAVEQ